MAVAGRILIMPKGAYSASVTYEMLDMVSHEGATWVAKKTSVGIAPSAITSEYWFQMVGNDAIDLDAHKAEILAEADQNVAVMKAAIDYDIALINLKVDNCVPLAGGTMNGALKAVNPAVGTEGVRNISAGTADLTAGTSALATGSIYIVYE